MKKGILIMSVAALAIPAAMAGVVFEALLVGWCFGRACVQKTGEELAAKQAGKS